MNLSKPFAGDYPGTMGFGDRSIHKNGHSGIDYALPVGTPVLAAADGVVFYAGLDRTGYGNCVIVKHGNPPPCPLPDIREGEDFSGEEGNALTFPPRPKTFPLSNDHPPARLPSVREGEFFQKGDSETSLFSNGIYTTIYAHLQRWIVREGQHVTRGMVIGYSGGAQGMEGAGFSTGAHLHFEVRKKPFRFTDAVDPAPMFLRGVAAVKLQKPSQITVVAPVVRVRLEPGLSGAFIRWARAGETLPATGSTADADGLRWREVLIPAWVAERDGTDELIEEADTWRRSADG